MAYNIVKHRRGTTEEWEASKVIPDDGELLIEELDGGFKRCKIGDGKNTFFKLKYIDEVVADVLLEKIETLQSILDTQVLNLKQETEKEFSTTRNEFNLDLQELENKLDSNYTEASKKVDELTDSFNSETIDIRLELANTTETINEVINTRFSSLSSDTEAISNKVSDELEVLDNKINEASSQTFSIINDLENRLVKNLTSSVDELNKQVELINNDVTQVAQTIEPSIKKAIDDQSAEFTAITNDITAQHRQTAEDINVLINDNAALAKNNLEVAQAEINKDFADLSTSIERLATNLDTLGESHSGLEANLDEYKIQNDNRVESLESSVDELEEYRELSESSISVINSKINKLESDALNNISDISELRCTSNDNTQKLASLEAVIKENKEDFESRDQTLDSRITATYNSLSDAKIALKKEISDLVNLTNNCLNSFEENLKNFQAAQQLVNADLTNSLNTYVSNIYVEILDLVDDDIATIEKVFALYNSLTDRINKLDSETIKGTAEELTTLNNNVESLSLQVDELRGYISHQDNAILDRLSATENKIKLILEHTTGEGLPIDNTLRDDFNKLADKVQSVLDTSEKLNILQEVINDSSSGLSATYALADDAYDNSVRSGAKILELENSINKNFIQVSANNLFIEEDLIIFNCGTASNDIIVN
jgi:chromosome segregation ATPase